MNTRVPQEAVVSLGDVEGPFRVLTLNDRRGNTSDDRGPSGDQSFGGLDETAIHAAVGKSGLEAL
jgi:hypothetical protein